MSRQKLPLLDCCRPKVAYPVVWCTELLPIQSADEFPCSMKSAFDITITAFPNFSNSQVPALYARGIKYLVLGVSLQKTYASSYCSCTIGLNTKSKPMSYKQRSISTSAKARSIHPSRLSSNENSHNGSRFVSSSQRSI
jgi:hypothetical protein